MNFHRAPLAIALVHLGCSTTVTQPPQPLEATLPPSSDGDGASLGSLQTRDRKVVLFASSTGLKFTVRARDGAVLADRIDLATLRTVDPHLYELCRAGVASRGTYLDATLTPSPSAVESESMSVGAPADRPHGAFGMGHGHRR